MSREGEREEGREGGFREGGREGKKGREDVTGSGDGGNSVETRPGPC